MKERRFTRAGHTNLQTAGFRSEELYAPEQALTLFFSRAALRERRVEIVSIEDAFGRVIARRIFADRAHPAVARSAMDGFAVRSRELPATLPISGEIAMGSVPPQLAPASVARIPTGGVLPEGADAVVPIEAVHVEGYRVRFEDAPKPGDCITPAGSDMRAGELLLEPGRRIGSPELGLLATLGIAEVEVYGKPQIAIVTSGDELVDIRTQPAAGQVRDSNRFAIAGALAQAGAVVKHFPIAPDDAERFTQILREALTQADAVVLSGGSSVGQSDLTPRIVASLGEPGVIVHGLRVRPGKPTMLGCVNGKPILGLPGNPASALLIFHAVGLPIVAELTGAKVWHAEVEAEFAQHYSKRPGWTWFVPVRLEEMPGRCVAHPLELRSSSASLAARASGFCTLGEAVETVREGEKVWVRRFSSF